MNARVVIIIGPIGAGKGTQSDILADSFGMLHVETSKFLEERFKSGGSDPKMIEEKAKWGSGVLNDPEWVTQVVIDKVTQLATEGKSLVFSSSPRTLYETEREMPVLESLFGRENVLIINILLSEAESIKRNSGRRICQLRHPIPNFPENAKLTHCPKDGTPLERRELDKPDVIKVRYGEYVTRTEPILKFLSERGYEVLPVNGEQSIEAVAEDILKHLQVHHQGAPTPIS
ncbi:MAG: nucleoside monophosphate kinase [bacterium]|nr:nucleoside monophosphate kinase [bacterium]